jgi:hypothetical protein
MIQIEDGSPNRLLGQCGLPEDPVEPQKVPSTQRKPRLLRRGNAPGLIKMARFVGKNVKNLRLYEIKGRHPLFQPRRRPNVASPRLLVAHRKNMPEKRPRKALTPACFCGFIYTEF